MDNPVVMAAVRACLDAGWPPCASTSPASAGGGAFSGGPEEVRDVAAAVGAPPDAAARDPAGVVGYSFGAWAGARAACDDAGVSQAIAVAPPLAFFDWTFVRDLRAPLAVIVGDRDRFCP